MSTLSTEDISVLIKYPDDPDDGRGTTVAIDPLPGETVIDLVERVTQQAKWTSHAYLKHVAPHIVIELRVKRRD